MRFLFYYCLVGIGSLHRRRSVQYACKKIRLETYPTCSVAREKRNTCSRPMWPSCRDQKEYHPHRPSCQHPFFRVQVNLLSKKTTSATPLILYKKATHIHRLILPHTLLRTPLARTPTPLNPVLAFTPTLPMPPLPLDNHPPIHRRTILPPNLHHHLHAQQALL